MSDKAKVGGTMMILYKLLDREIITEINGCISTGKEANVYHCTGGGGDDTGQSTKAEGCLVSLRLSSS